LASFALCQHFRRIGGLEHEPNGPLPKGPLTGPAGDLTEEA